MAITDETAKNAYLYGYSMDKAYEFLHEAIQEGDFAAPEFELLAA